MNLGEQGDYTPHHVLVINIGDVALASAEVDGAYIKSDSSSARRQESGADDACLCGSCFGACCVSSSLHTACLNIECLIH